MKTMSADGFDRARRWLMDHGRALDRARFLFRFEGGASEVVRGELAAYRNGDGGFGRGLEADVRLAGSSVIATTVGLQVLREIGADASDGLVRGAIGYLLEALDRDALAWMNVPAHVDEAPHAPWWGSEQKPETFTANPGAEIVGHFHHWASLVPGDLLVRLADAAMAHLRGLADTEMHDVFCYEAMRQTAAVPERVRAEVLRLARPLVAEVVETEPAKWADYCPRPLQVAGSRESPYFEMFREAVSANLDYLVDTQEADGAWRAHWSWGADAGEAWEQAKRDWQGVLVVEHVGWLRAFGRIAKAS